MRKTFKSILAFAGTGMVLVVLAFTTAVPANAITSSERHEQMANNIRDNQSDLTTSLDVLKGRSQDEWTPVDIEVYLANAMWAVHYGIAQYKFDHESLPESVEALTGTEYIPVWPENPFNNFEPMKVLSESDGFKPGELVLLICPPDQYSGIKNPRPLSYELGVYGPDVEFAQYGNADVELNIEWASVPTGVLYMVGAHTESQKHLLEKWEKKHSKKAEE